MSPQSPKKHSPAQHSPAQHSPDRHSSAQHGAGELASGGEPLPALASRLGYLLKHAQLRLAELTSAALAPLGISGRQCAVLIAIDSRVPLSQQEVAGRLGVDRTTMVALIDELEDQGLVQRHRDPDDRRKNVVALTEVGRTTLRQGTQASEGAERRFLESLSAEQTAQLKVALRAITFPASAGLSSELSG